MGLLESHEVEISAPKPPDCVRGIPPTQSAGFSTTTFAYWIPGHSQVAEKEGCRDWRCCLGTGFTNARQIEAKRKLTNCAQKSRDPGAGRATAITEARSPGICARVSDNIIDTRDEVTQVGLVGKRIGEFPMEAAENQAAFSFRGSCRSTGRTRSSSRRHGPQSQQP